MKSQRLPRKALLDIGGCTILERAVINLRASELIDEVVVTTSSNIDDDPIEDFSRQKNIPFYRGNENNVLDRYWNAAKIFGADVIVRATGDNPFVSFEIADYVINSHMETAADFTGIERGKLPVGVSTEAISYYALDSLIQQDLDFNYSEYMAFYFINNPNFFLLNILPPPKKFISVNPKVRLTVDYPEDLELSQSLINIINPCSKPIALDRILELLTEYPQLAQKNQNLPIKWQDQTELIKKLDQMTRITTG